MVAIILVLFLLFFNAFGFYTEWENCILNLNNKTLNSSGVAATICEGLSNLLSIPRRKNYNDKYRSNFYFGDEVNLDQANYCFLGTGLSNRPNHQLLNNNDKQACRSRNIWDRPYRLLHEGETKTSDYISEFIVKALDFGYGGAMFLGDSISMQLFRMNSCDMFRNGYVIEKCGKFSPLGFTGNVKYGCDAIKMTSERSFSMQAHRLFFPYHDHKLYVWKNTSNETLFSYFNGIFKPMLNSNAPENINTVDLDLGRYHPLKCNSSGHSNDMNDSSSKMAKGSVRKIIVFNYGLHYRLNDAPEVMQSTAHALLTYAKLLRKAGHLFVFRETTAQHFNTVDGTYSGHTARHNTSKINECCVENDDTSLMYFRDIQFQNILYSIDPGWKRYIVWMDFYKHSNRRPIYGLHLENILGFETDCTHYSYSEPLQGFLAQALLSIFY